MVQEATNAMRTEGGQHGAPFGEIERALTYVSSQENESVNHGK